MTDKHYMEISTKCHSDQSINVETGGRNYDFKGSLTVSLSEFSRSLHLYDNFLKTTTVNNFMKSRQTLW